MIWQGNNWSGTVIAAASVPERGLCFGPAAEFAIEISSEFVVPNDFHIAV
jgi:hypothetical protein